ncbi:hypothetical protein BC939DRAFT_472952 [Gamsiella multidivaricata]|uniref:uncharacterized protein n=1 Tax=Gamsiella multidivaricata TaxID=101098 RepID=UPI00221EA275|nr:uncharacterized protein BC939DRAFT_472952 [Gamsiella multidivaricata]KAI7831378.1 hypothetical protein BC939DRAFT_472952 [Gamsiella multidivaricata]
MSMSMKSQQFTLEEFKSASPDDLSPAAFLQWIDGTFKDKEKLHLAYVSLYSQAKKSPVPEIRKDGKEMQRMWKDRGTSLDNYWSKNVIAAARNSSALQIAVGEQHLKDALRGLQGSQKQRSQEQLPAQEQEQQQEQGTSTLVLLGDELSSNLSDSDFQPSTSTSARTSLFTADFH